MLIEYRLPEMVWDFIPMGVLPGQPGNLNEEINGGILLKVGESR